MRVSTLLGASASPEQGRAEGRRARPFSALQALTLLGTALLGFGLVTVVGDRKQARERPNLPGGLAMRVNGPAGTPAERLSRLQDRVRTRPKDAPSWAALGSAYVEAARLSADPGYYPKAEGAFEKSLALEPAANANAMAGMAALANARHDFTGALTWAEKAIALDPERAAAWAPLGDALIELGRYEEGFDAIQQMVDLEPSLASYARVSYGRELQGDVAAAAEALEAAAGVAPGRPEKAFATFQLGELHWNAGRVPEAVAAYRQASALDAGFVAPQAALARAAWAEGRTDEAIEAYRRVVDRLPAPQYVTELADLFTVTGQPEEASEQFSLLDAQQRILAANGVNVDLEASLFSADHRIGLAEGLAGARSEWDRRKSVFVADALAWQLHANGRDTEALVHADQALRLGTANALFHFHRSQIRLALGDRNGARTDLQRAVDINPNFSILHSPTAHEQLLRLRLLSA